MQDCLFVAAMGPPGGGRAAITQRYQRHYNLLSINDFDAHALEHIFGNILGACFRISQIRRTARLSVLVLRRDFYP
jgi:dynein heavy chain